MSRFVTQVPLRWADLDAFRHVNNARVVTLLEQARVELVFGAGAEHGAGAWSQGLLVAELAVEYKKQIPYRGQSLLVSIWSHQVRAASFLLEYQMYVGAAHDDPVAVTARTKMVPFDLVAGHPRRLTEVEREFLAKWSDDVTGSSTATDR